MGAGVVLLGQSAALCGPQGAAFLVSFFAQAFEEGVLGASEREMLQTLPIYEVMPARQDNNNDDDEHKGEDVTAVFRDHRAPSSVPRSPGYGQCSESAALRVAARLPRKLASAHARAHETLRSCDLLKPRGARVQRLTAQSRAT